jgi:deoxyadenosine/deoxycytidine kinase
MVKLSAETLLEREPRVSYGPVPTHLFDRPLGEMSWQMQDGEFLLRAEGDYYFFYRPGEGVTVHRGTDADDSEESLWLNGSVYAAIASMNGLLPIHASAIAYEDKVFAFTGPAGAGKSTLAAALGWHGLPMFCDDTLILDLSTPEHIMCLPGHKRLKLRPDAFELSGASREEKVSRTYEKYYAAPAAGTVGTAMPIAELIFLEDGPDPVMTRISGSERFVRMQDDHQTSYLFEAANRYGRIEQFAHRARLAQQIEMTSFARPRDAARFEEGVALVAKHVMKPRSAAQ